MASGFLFLRRRTVSTVRRANTGIFISRLSVLCPKVTFCLTGGPLGAYKNTSSVLAIRCLDSDGQRVASLWPFLFLGLRVSPQNKNPTERTHLQSAILQQSAVPSKECWPVGPIRCFWAEAQKSAIFPPHRALSVLDRPLVARGGHYANSKIRFEPYKRTIKRVKENKQK